MLIVFITLRLLYSPVEATEVTIDFFEERATWICAVFILISSVLVANDSSFELKTTKKCYCLQM